MEIFPSYRKLRLLNVMLVSENLPELHTMLFLCMCIENMTKTLRMLSSRQNVDTVWEICVADSRSVIIFKSDNRNTVLCFCNAQCK